MIIKWNPFELGKNDFRISTKAMMIPISVVHSTSIYYNSFNMSGYFVNPSFYKKILIKFRMVLKWTVRFEYSVEKY